MTWSFEEVPTQTGRVMIVTGANSGLGFETAWMLAARGAHVIMACRNPSKAETALAEARKRAPGATLETMALDLASLASVRAFAATVQARFPAVHALVNNAGVMALPYQKTADGFEIQLGTNHFGHFALTGLLFDRLLAGGTAERPSRVVNISSGLHRAGTMLWDDLDGARSYSKWQRYGQSKLANLLFTYALDRRLRARSAPMLSTASHPGYAATNLQFEAARQEGSAFKEGMMRWVNALFAQSSEHGAWPSVYAAAAADVQGGDYYGPAIAEAWGAPKKVGSNAASRIEADQDRLWEVSQTLTGVRWLD